MELFDKIQSYNMLFIYNLPNIISSGYFSAAKVGKPHMGIGRLIHTSHSGHGSYPSLAAGCTAMCPAAIISATTI